MGTVFKKQSTRPLPPDAEIFTKAGERWARWTACGKTKLAPLTIGQDGTKRITTTAATYTAKYRDGAGIVREVATGCRDESAARRVLADLERRAELVKANVLTHAEDAIADHQAVALTSHFDDYCDHQLAAGVTTKWIDLTRQRFETIVLACRFGRLGDINAHAVTKWLASQQAKGMSPRTRNTYRNSVFTFLNWCVKSGRLTANPLVNVPRLNERIDCRRQRRALTEDEIVRLLDAAQRRPKHEALTIRTGRRKGTTTANVRPDVIEDLDRVGLERALIYKTLLTTGLRLNELASITIGQVDLDGKHPALTLDARDAKNRQAAIIPLRSDLVDDLRDWLADRLDILRRGKINPPKSLPLDAKLFTVPAGLVRILNRDLKAAGIAKRDDRGRTVDVHALRHTFGTMLSRHGVAPRVAQAALRHSRIDLTMNVYTDPRLLDVGAAIDALPRLDTLPESTPLGRLPRTGTDDNPRFSRGICKLGCTRFWTKIDRFNR